MSTDEGEEVEKNFMGKTKAQYKWPRPLDQIWIARKDTVIKIQKPQPCKKKSHTYKIFQSETTKMEEKLMSVQKLKLSCPVSPNSNTLILAPGVWHTRTDAHNLMHQSWKT